MEDTLNSKLMIINDSSDDELFNTVKSIGFQCVTQVDSRHALQEVREKSVDIIFLVSSSRSPGYLELIQNIDALILDIPIVMIAEELDPPLIRKAVQSGACDFLIRPFSAKDIPVVVARNVERKLLSRKQLQKKQSDVLLKAIKSLIAAMEAKDKYTSGHSIRIVKYAMMMGKRLNMTDDEKFILQLSAALHDIGKIGIPDNILKSAESLKDMEYILVKEHPVIGSKIVGRIDELKEVAANIKHHHERYDGTGYPDGLKGEVIPLISRILSIADAYESLISDRLYRKGQPHQDAIEELQVNGGTQFDPELLTIFIDELTSKSMAVEDDWKAEDVRYSKVSQ